MGAVLCEIYVKGMMTGPFSSHLGSYEQLFYHVQLKHLIVGNLPGQFRLYSHKDILVLSEPCPAKTVNPAPLSSPPPISHVFCFPPLLCLLLVANMVVYIDYFSGPTAAWICECHVVPVYKDGAKRKGILYFFPSCMLHSADLGM